MKIPSTPQFKTTRPLSLLTLFFAGATGLLAQVTIISTDFTGRTVSGTTFSNISWSGDAATSSTTSLQAIRIDNNGTQVRNIDADIAGFLSVSSDNNTESWRIDITLTATQTVSASNLNIGWASSTTGTVSPGFGFALYDTSAPTSNLANTPFGGGTHALGYAITGTVQPSGSGALSSAMTGNVTPVDAYYATAVQSTSLTLDTSVELMAGHSYVMRVAVFENNAGHSGNIYLDSLALTTAAVPESSTYAALAGLAALGLAAFRRRRRAAA